MDSDNDKIIETIGEISKEGKKDGSKINWMNIIGMRIRNNVYGVGERKCLGEEKYMEYLPVVAGNNIRETNHRALVLSIVVQKRSFFRHVLR